MVCSNGPRNYKCPEDLELLVTHLHPDVYKDISVKPSLGKTLAISASINPNKTVEEVMKDYEEQKRYFEEKNPVMKTLREYGDEIDGIVFNLSNHVLGCPECLRNYQTLAREWAQDMIKISDCSEDLKNDADPGVEITNTDIELDIDSLEKEFDFNALRIFVGNEPY